MNSISKAASKPEFYISLFLLCFVLFNWPLLSAIRNNNPEALFLSVFSIWAAVIVFLFLVKKRGKGAASDGTIADQEEAEDV